MSKIRLIGLVALGLGALVLLAFRLKLLPERHEVRDQLAGIDVFWHDQEAFLFVHRTGIAHRHNWLTDHVSPGWRMGLAVAGLEEWRPLGHSTRAIRLAAGRLERFDLANTPAYPAWELKDDRLAALPRGFAESPEAASPGYRWTGSGFERLLTLVQYGKADGGAATTPKRLQADDEPKEDEAEEEGPISASEKETFKKAGWHFKSLSGYEADGQPVEIVLGLREGAYTLSLKSVDSSDPLLRKTPSATISGPGLPAPEVLVAAAESGWRDVARDELERRIALGPARLSPDGAGSPNTPWRLATLVACAVFALWLAWKGPTRGLKIALTVFVALFVAQFAMNAGAGPAVGIVATLAVINIASMAAGVLLVTYRVKRTLLPVTESACPAYALGNVKTLTDSFRAIGFQFVADRQTTWKMGGQERKTFVRFLKHNSGQSWAEIHAMDNPRLIGRLIASLKDGGVSVSTGDRQANQELIPAPKTLRLRVPTASSCSDMAMAHQAFAMKTPGRLRTIDDPMAADAEAHAQWVGHLLRTGRVTASGEWFRISPRAALPIIVRVMGAWFT